MFVDMNGPIKGRTAKDMLNLDPSNFFFPLENFPTLTNRNSDRSIDSNLFKTLANIVEKVEKS